MPSGPEPDAPAPPLGLVAIGRNEGERLRRCLVSAVAAGAPVVYVDSGSVDDSPALAESLGVRVVHLDPAQGFTAARARNLGFEALRAAEAPPLFVQFLDGDCELRPDWLETARAALEADPGLAAVAGRRRERFPEASIFNRLCDMEWNTPVGPARAVGGDAMYRTAALEAVGGFDPAFICGEEPELCFRLRAEGWRIERLDREMTLHDAAMTRWSQWARRAERSGWAFAEGAAVHGASPEGYNLKERRSLLIWGGLWPAALALLLLAAAALAAAGSGGWPAALGLFVLGLALGALQALRVARGRRARFGEPWRQALLYGGLVMLAKPFQLRGALRFLRGRRRGGRARLIEYKDAGGTRA